MIAREDIEKSIASFLTVTLGLPGTALKNTPLVTGGVLDSLSYLRLVRFLETEFAIAVKIEDFVPENFDSVSRIEAFVGKKLAGK